MPSQLIAASDIQSDVLCALVARRWFGVGIMGAEVHGTRLYLDYELSDVI